MVRHREPTPASLGHALFVIVFLVAVLAFSLIVLGADPHIPLVMATIVASLVGILSLGYAWHELEEAMIHSIGMAMQAVLILMIIGSVIGTWILSGTVPTMIYYGLQILSPGIFLIATVLICSVVSLSTGSSWTTAGTDRKASPSKNSFKGSGRRGNHHLCPDPLEHLWSLHVGNSWSASLCVRSLCFFESAGTHCQYCPGIHRLVSGIHRPLGRKLTPGQLKGKSLLSILSWHRRLCFLTFLFNQTQAFFL